MEGEVWVSCKKGERERELSRNEEVSVEPRKRDRGMGADGVKEELVFNFTKDMVQSGVSVWGGRGKWGRGMGDFEIGDDLGRRTR